MSEAGTGTGIAVAAPPPGAEATPLSGARDEGLRLHFALPNGVRLGKLADGMLAAMHDTGFKNWSDSR